MSIGFREHALRGCGMLLHPNTGIVYTGVAGLIRAECGEDPDFRIVFENDAQAHVFSLLRRLADGEVGRRTGLASDADDERLFADWYCSGDFEIDLHQTD